MSPHRGEEDVAARLVRLGLQRDSQVRASGLDVCRDRVHPFLVALERGVQVLGPVIFRALTAAPHDKRRRTHLDGDVDRTKDLA